MLIQNFGRLWERKYINFGRGGLGNKGHLKGYVTGNREADFREQIGIYVLYDKDFMPIYIGQVGRGRKKLLSRLNDHETDHLWNRWDYFTWFGFRRVNKNGTLSKLDNGQKVFKTRGEKLLNEIEGALITALEPRFNKQGARWKDVEEFFQERDPKVEEATVGDLMERFESIESKIKALGKGPNHKTK
ncbi:MAG: GIY-YIG nuclease family protein [Acidobacteriota bacterium]|nr:GIY-YIG nuclease family protein [Acidobacteriota bacterium]MDE3163390.1 GIY-YIG nuclease family protein [Acidobacteriota bacterium]